MLVNFAAARHLSGVELSFVWPWIVATALLLALAVSVLWMPDRDVLRVLAWCRPVREGAGRQGGLK
jgi:hypothetical protein